MFADEKISAPANVEAIAPAPSNEPIAVDTDNKLANEALSEANEAKAVVDSEKAEGTDQYAQDGSGISWTKAEERSVLRKVDIAIVSFLRATI
jgi:hypothetical protein